MPSVPVRLATESRLNDTTKFEEKSLKMIFITLASSLAVATLPATRSWMNTADTPQVSCYSYLSNQDNAFSKLFLFAPAYGHLSR